MRQLLRSNFITKKIYSKYHFAEKSKDLLKRKFKNTQIKVGDPKTKIYRDRNDIHSVCKSKNIMSKILIKDIYYRFEDKHLSTQK